MRQSLLRSHWLHGPVDAPMGSPDVHRLRAITSARAEGTASRAPMLAPQRPAQGARA